MSIVGTVDNHKFAQTCALPQLTGGGGNGTSTHTRFDQCLASESNYQVWTISPPRPSFP
jgi:hypothetical protein